MKPLIDWKNTGNLNAVEALLLLAIGFFGALATLVLIRIVTLAFWPV